MSPEQLQQCRTVLQQLQQALEEEIADLEQAARPVQLDQQAFGRVSRGEALQQQEMAQANLMLCRNRLQDVRHALIRFSEDEYGYCEGCDETIPLARLLARPDSRLCINCQSKTE